MAIVLNGTDQYASAVAGLLSNEPLTISAWFKPDDITTSGMVAAFNGGAADFLAVQARGAISGDPVAAMSYGGAWAVVDSTTSFTSGVWHNVIGVFSGDTSRSVWLDGEGKATNTASQVVTVGNDFNIGTHNQVSAFFKGSLSYVTLWDKALSDAEALSEGSGNGFMSVATVNIVNAWSLVSDAVADAGIVDLTLFGVPSFNNTDAPEFNNALAATQLLLLNANDGM